MELIKKINKNYLSLSFSILMAMVMALGMGSCKRGSNGNKGDENTGTPSISFKQGTLIGNDKTTELTVGGAYMPAGFEIKVEVTNGFIEIGGHKLADKDQKPLNELLGSEDKVEEGKDVTVKVGPTDGALPFEATVTVLNKDDVEVDTSTLVWTPGVTKDFEAEITDGIVNGKITVTVKAKESGNPVKIEAGDLADLEVTSASDQAKDGATITGLDFKFTDIDGKGVIKKDLAVTPGTKDTKLTIVVKKGGAIIEQKVITLPGVDAYALALDKNKIDDGATKVTITVTKNGKNLDATELAKLKLKVKRVSGSNGTLAGQSAGNVDLKNPNVLTIAGDQKSASLELTIDPQGDKKLKFKLELLNDKKAVQGGKQTLKWEDGFNILFSDVKTNNAGKQATYKIHNKGKSVIKVAKLVVQVTNKSAKNAKLNNVEYTPGETKTVNDAAFIGNADIAIGNKTPDFTVILDNLTNPDEAKFGLELMYDNKKTGVKQVVNWLAKDIRLDFVDKTQLDLVTATDVDFAIQNTGDDKTDKAKVKLKITKTRGDNPVKIGGKQFDVGSDTTIALNKAINKVDGAQALKLVIDANGGNAAEFELQLVYDGKDVAGAVKTVTWIKAVTLEVASNTPFIKDEDPATITVKNTSLVDVTPSLVTVNFRATIKNVASKAIFDVGNSSSTAAGGLTAQLDTILGNNNPILAGSTVTFELKLKNSKGSPDSSLSFGMNYGNQGGYPAFATAEVLEWKNTAVTLEVEPSPTCMKYLHKPIIIVTNTSPVDVTPADVTVTFGVNNGAAFDLGNAVGKKNADSVTLQDILGDNTAIVSGGKVTFVVANGENNSWLSFTMEHKGKVAFAPRDTNRFLQWMV